MRVSFESKGNFNNAERWLNDIAKTNMQSPLNQIASQGTQSLASKTPTDTGATAAGWKGTVTSRGDISEIVWTNNAHPQAGVSVAKIIDLGHGTGTGSYVAPRPYIKDAMAPVWSKLDNVIRELIK